MGMDWDKDISESVKSWMDTIGRFNPTPDAEEKMIGGLMYDQEEDAVMKTFFDSAQLRELACALIEVAAWLDKRDAKRREDGCIDVEFWIGGNKNV